MTPSRKVPVTMPAPPGGSRGWLRGIRFSGFSFVMLGLLLLAVVVLAPTVRMVVSQQQQIADLRAAVAAKKDAVTHLQEERARWDDPSYIRAQARERLYYVMPGELSFLVIDDRTPAQAADGSDEVSSSLQHTKTNWLQSFFAASLTAGLSDEAVK